MSFLTGLALPAQLVAQTNGQIAFAQQIGSGGQGANVFIANPDGTHMQQVPLVNLAEDFGVPIWSPEGTKLLISHTVRLDNTGQCCLFQPATVNPDGSTFNQLDPPSPPGASSDGMDCGAWFPDGTRLLCGFGGAQPGVFSIRASDGGDAIRLTTYPFGPNCNGCDYANDISSDGKRFVFLRSRRENFGTTPSVTQQVALFVENTDGTGLRQLTPYGLAAPHERASARWSPDGTKIISGMHNGQLFIVHPDGTGLTTLKLQVGTQRYFAFEPHWSPDSTRIIFGMFVNGQEGLFTANPDGSDVVQITSTLPFVNLYSGPDWGTHPLEQ
jgi:Tol biopolymer transport system component